MRRSFLLTCTTINYTEKKEDLSRVLTPKTSSRLVVVLQNHDLHLYSGTMARTFSLSSAKKCCLGLEECKFVMLVSHDSEICHAHYARAPLFCHAETLFVMQNRQHLEAQKLVMLSQHLWPPRDTPPSSTSFQTQTFLRSIFTQDIEPSIPDDKWAYYVVAKWYKNKCALHQCHVTFNTIPTRARLLSNVESDPEFTTAFSKVFYNDSETPPHRRFWAGSLFIEDTLVRYKQTGPHSVAKVDFFDPQNLQKDMR